MPAAPAEQGLGTALGTLAAALRATGAPAMIIGGIAVIARGVPRQAVDVGATVWADTIALGDRVAILGTHGIVSRIEGAVDFAREHQVFLLRHEATGTAIELSLAWEPRNRDDVERLLTLHGPTVDLDRMRALVREFSVALDDAERLQEFEAIVARARGPHGDAAR